MNWNERFASMLAYRETAKARHSATCDAIQQAYNAEVVKEWRKVKPRAKLALQDDGRLAGKRYLDIPQAVREALFKRWSGGIVAAYTEREKRLQDRIARALRFLAGRCTIPQTERAVLYAEHDPYNFNSQGYGAESYARGNAEVQAAGIHECRAEVWSRFDIYTSAGRDLETGKYIPNRHGWGAESRTSYGHSMYMVMVYTTELGAEIIRYRPGATLREWVRLCWKKGVNPRVMNPFLPYDYEARMGIDYFGNDLRMAETGKAAGE